MIEHILSHQHELLTAFQETGIMIVAATINAIILGFPLGALLYCFKPDGLSPKPFYYSILNTIVNVVRSFPFMLLIFVLMPLTRLLVSTSFGTIASIVPLSVIAIAMFSRFVEQSFLEISPDVLQAAKAMGATPTQTIIHFVLVESKSSLIRNLTSSVISITSYSAVMGFVGGGGIGDFAMRYGYQSYDMVLMFTAVIVMIILIQGIQWFGHMMARTFDKRRTL